MVALREICQNETNCARFSAADNSRDSVGEIDRSVEIQEITPEATNTLFSQLEGLREQVNKLATITKELAESEPDTHSIHDVH